MRPIIPITLAAVLIVALVFFLYGPEDAQNTEANKTMETVTRPVSMPEGICFPEGVRILEGSVTNVECCGDLTLLPCKMPEPVDLGCMDKCLGELYCSPCGNGECDIRENFCNCPEDCSKEDYGSPSVRSSLLNVTDYSDEAEMLTEIEKSLSSVDPNAYSAWKSYQGGEDIVYWLFYYDPNVLGAVLDDLEASKFISIDSEEKALDMLNTIFPNPDNTTIEDSGDFWTACATSGNTETCCEIPKVYGPGAQMSCS